MGRLKHCAEKSSFSDKTKEKLISQYDELVKGGMDESEATDKVVMDYHKELEDRLEKFKASIPKSEPKVDKNEVFKREPVKVLDAHYMINARQKQQLIDDGYDNATIQAAIKETNRIMALPAHEAFEELGKKGIFNLGKGEKLDVRPDVGLDKDQYNATVKQLEEGKRTKTVEKLLDFIDNIKKTGNISTIQGTGGSSIKVNMPLVLNILGEKSNSEVGLTEADEAAELEKEAAREQVFAEEGKFQKEAKFKGDITATVEAIKKALPKVKVVMDSSIKGAAQVQGNTIKINPEYAGLDSPIHEAGHILIDALGFKDKVIQDGINQLKETKLWAETKERYPELNDEMLAKEVLAEAIGREGAGIFDKVNKQARFMQVLNYLFDKLKQLFGIDKNVAKSLAKQIISGIGTKELVGENEVVQEQKESGEEDQQKARLLIDKLAAIEDLSAIPYETLVEYYSAIDKLGSFKGVNKLREEVMRRIALNMKERGLADAKIKYSQGILASKDISWFDKWFKVLSHFSDAFPEMKELSKLWNSAFFTKMKEARNEKNTHDKLAIDVIKERNKKLGLSIEGGKEVLLKLITTRNHKYFDFLDNGSGKILTIEEAKKKKLSEPQIAYLNYVRDLIAKRKGITQDIGNVDMDVIKLDKGFSEAFQSDGVVAAVGGLFGGGNNLHETVISFTNPNTGKEQKATYGEVQKILSSYAEKGISENAKATFAMIAAGRKAKKQLKQDIDSGKVKVGTSEYVTLDENGNLKSKFGDRNPSRAYSKDFYSAVNEYIDDSMHIKHISPLVPIINSIEYLNKKGVLDGEGEALARQKKNVSEWLDKWIKLHVLQKPEETTPELDKILRTLRFMTSGITMWFNVPANIMNIAIGNYNQVRQDSLKEWALGQARLFGGTKRKYGIVNKYAYDIVKKYVAVSNDVDSNPIMTAKNFFSELGFLGQKWGEFQIQGSGLLGLMDENDYKSFEYKKNKYNVDELVVKEDLSAADKKALEDRILSIIDRVSDVQGKYSEKDRRNIQNNELGKIALQFRQWLPDAWRVRYGSEGSWRKQFNGGFSELRKQIQDKGFQKVLFVDSKNKSEEAKDFMRNLKGLMATGLLMSLVYTNDDDDDKSFAARMFQKALSDVLFVFDPESLKFTLERPIPAITSVTKLIDMADHLFAFEADDFYKGDSKYGDKGDSKLQGDVISLLPGRKLAEQITDEE